MVEPAVGEALTAECHALCRYLVDLEPAPDVVAAYRTAHALGRVDRKAPTPTDRALLRIVHRGPAFARLADAYAGVFAGNSLLRRKLVLLVALLETRAATATRIDTAVPGSRVGWVFGVAAQGIAWIVRVILGALLVAAVRLRHPRGGRR